MHRLTAAEEGLWTDVAAGSGMTGARAVRVGSGPWQELFGGSTPLDLDAAQRLLSAAPPVHPSGAPSDLREAAGSVALLSARFGTGLGGHGRGGDPARRGRVVDLQHVEPTHGHRLSDVRVAEAAPGLPGPPSGPAVRTRRHDPPSGPV